MTAPVVIPKKPTLDQILRLEEHIKANFEEGESTLEHHFADGIYARVLHLAAGTVLTGKMHRHSTFNILAQGTITATNDDGEVVTMTAPKWFVSKPMLKKVGACHTDVIWINVHPTEETDLAVIESQFIVPEDEVLQLEAAKCLGAQ